MLPLCMSCRKIVNHCSGVKNDYYNCLWCNNKLVNSPKNRREHGLKCHYRPPLKAVCHCTNICVNCLKQQDKCYYFQGCGCQYCSRCNCGYGINVDTCVNCDDCITQIEIQACITKILTKNGNII